VDGLLRIVKVTIKPLIPKALFLLLISLAGASYAQVPQIERDALVALYNSTDGANWTDNTGWLGEAGTECSWFGVRCYADSGKSVSNLSLWKNGLNGTIPSELGNLSNLTYLHLGSNSLTGTIPSELGNLTKLTAIYLYSNALTGTIPSELDSLTKLTTTNYDGNLFVGAGFSISSVERDALVALYNSTDGANWTDNTGWLGEAGTECIWFGVTCSSGSVAQIVLNGNSLSGSIPSELGNLSNLTYLHLGSNSLTGTIPSELGNLTKLTYIFLFSNSLTDSIPSELGNLTNLTNLNLSKNSLTGSIPSELGNLTKLTYLLLHDNLLTGNIPDELKKLTKLSYLWLSWGNSFTGTIPRELQKLSTLTVTGGAPSSTLRVNHNNHFVEDLDRDGIDDEIDEDLGSPAPTKKIVTPDYSLSILGSGRVVNLVSNSTYKNEFKEIAEGNKLGTENAKLVTNILYKHFEDAFDFITIAGGCVDSVTCNNKARYHGRSFPVKRDVEGIGSELIDYTREYGSDGKLRSVNHYSHLNGLTYGPSLHEIMHAWGNHIEFFQELGGLATVGQVCSLAGHWGNSNIGGQLGGWQPQSLKELGGGAYQAKGYSRDEFGGIAQGDNSAPFSNFELYLMGLIGIDEVGHDIKIAQDLTWADQLKGSFEASTIHTVSMEEVIKRLGKRSPDHLNSQKDFRAMYVIVSEEPLALNEWGYIDKQIHDFQLQASDDFDNDFNFWEATQGKATMTFGQTDTFLKTEAISLPLVDGSDDSPAAGVDTTDRDGSSKAADAVSPSSYTTTADWPSPYNGITPDSSYALEFNNVGVLNSADATIHVCLRIFTDGLPSSVNGISQFDMELKVASLSDATVQITKFREFNTIGALNEKAQTPDCSGIFETTTGVYTDIIQTDTSVLETTWNLIDPTNLILKLDSFKQLTAN
jgi:hypothetical protein